MKHLTQIIVPLALVFSSVCCGSEPLSEGRQENAGGTPPASITVTPSSVTAGVDGLSQTVEITAPARPQIEVPAGAISWLSVEEGTYNDNKVTSTVVVASNPTYYAREADLTISASGASPVTLHVSQARKEPVKDFQLPDNRAVTVSETLGLGWNLGNQLDAFVSDPGENFLQPDETCWGNSTATQATFNAVKAAGFKTVRIPVTWLAKIGPAPDYVIDKAWIDRVYEVVQLAHNAGLYVIVNTHHDENHHTIQSGGADIDTRWQDILAAAASEDVNRQIKEEIAAVWKQIALRFADCGDWLILEGFNEINDGGWGWSEAFRADPTLQCNILNEWNQTFVDAVRSTGGDNATRWLGVPTYAASPDFTGYFTLPADPVGKLMLSVHFYNPSEYTIGKTQHQQWGHTGKAGKKDAYYGEEQVKACFDALYQNFVAKDIPVYIGEFGCSVRSKSDSVAWAFYLYYLEYVVKAAKVYGLPCFLWDNGSKGSGQEHHAYLDHGTGAYVGNAREVVGVMTKARYTTDDVYTLQFVYDSAPQFP